MNSTITGTMAKVTSYDGTPIGYRSFGSGPSVILVEGAMGTAQNYRQLALTMSDRYTVYLPDRRGRGMSPLPYNARHSITDDVEDLRCLIEHTRAPYLFGLSSGAMIVLEALRTGLPIKRAAVYEPPFYLNGMPTHLIPSFNAQVEQGQLAEALVTAMDIVGLGPKVLKRLPRWVRRASAKSMLLAESIGTSPYASLEELIPAMRYDFNVVASMNKHMQHLRDVHTPVLLMGGSKSPDYLRKALVSLRNILQFSQTIEFNDGDHSAPWNEDLGGMPMQVGGALKNFFPATSS